MRIGFDAKRLFHNFTGLGNYSRTLVNNLAVMFPKESWHLFTPSLSDNPRVKPFLDDSRFQIHQPGKNRFLWRSWRIQSDLEKSGLDLYHGLSHEIPFGLKTSSGFKTIVTIHDLIFKIFPEQYRLPDRIIYDTKFSYSCRKADHIIAISTKTKEDITRFYGIAEEKISVIYQACDPQFYVQREIHEREAIRQKYHLPSEYILYVGSVTERKNLLSIVKAIHHMNESQRIPLVVVGDGGSYKRNVMHYITQNHLEKWVIFVQNLSYPDLPAIYQSAAAFVYPSLYEGFGIPIIEALISKTPVITSDRASLPEAAGPDSICTDPLNTELLASHIQKVTEDQILGNHMREQGVLYVERFHFSTVTQQMMQLYHKTAGMD